MNLKKDKLVKKVIKEVYASVGIKIVDFDYVEDAIFCIGIHGHRAIDIFLKFDLIGVNHIIEQSLSTVVRHKSYIRENDDYIVRKINKEIRKEN